MVPEGDMQVSRPSGSTILLSCSLPGILRDQGDIGWLDGEGAEIPATGQR